uniref:transducin beta-like protein 3 n=1 Tax=Podarcis muralis TaxID=64176 RepID=UPI0010A0424B|nr:transducin beta-like protein 3 [Podarcis muralis]XP_028571339.1 transducin beta-like protein 3 [Podarcis muralis]
MSNPSKRHMMLVFHWVRKKPLTEKPCSTISARPSASAPACNTPHISPLLYEEQDTTCSAQEVQQVQGAAITESHRPQVLKICHWQRWPEESPQAWQAKEDSSGYRKMEAVLKFSITWNTNSRNYLEAQAVVETLLKHETPESLLQYKGIKAAVESLLPYTALPEAGPVTAGLHVP